MKKIRFLLTVFVLSTFISGLFARERISYFVSPEDFGCISDDITKANHNSERLQKMVDYASENGLKIIANANKRYYTSNSIIINSPVSIDFNRATLVATDTINMIVVNDGKGRRFSGIISGLCLDLNKKAKSGIDCSNAVKLHIQDCWITGVPKKSSGLLIEKGYEIFVNNIHIEGGEKGAIGINIKTPDCHFSDCAIIDCHTAVYCSGSNVFERIHAWMGHEGRWLDGSIFFKINTLGPVFLEQCYSDTFDISFQIECKTNLFLSQLRNFQNKGMWKKDSNNINPVVFKFKDGDVASKSDIILINSHVGSLYINEKNKQKLTNYRKHKILIENTIINN